MWWDRTGQLFDEASVIEFQTWLFTYGLFHSRFSLADVRALSRAHRLGKNSLQKYFPRKSFELNFLIVLSLGWRFLIRQVRYCAADLSELCLVLSRNWPGRYCPLAPLNQNNYVLEWRGRNWYPALSVFHTEIFTGEEMQCEVKMVAQGLWIYFMPSSAGISRERSNYKSDLRTHLNLL